ncbi:PREDICTED: uncharacterized protein LOC105561051 isoform X2 [Vollenhovia emeryi]|nr:PREDICTED: uncharacterized protein LOC105561051 isoform X2 [Vollenhovia emeryi]XP_011866090.1 PREDICTED: uncharacterized protein LOC105561051 isoform X2 [Vollenhovia emeryi]
MSILCGENYEITFFLRNALIAGSRLEYVYSKYGHLVTDYVSKMILFEDSDLYAVISYLRITPCLLLNINKIFIRESIRQKFLWLIEKYLKNIACSKLPISIFHTEKELYEEFARRKMGPVCSEKLHMVSIWSQDVVFAKVLATKLHTDITFINAYFEFPSNMMFFDKWMGSTIAENDDIWGYVKFCDLYENTCLGKTKDKINLNKYAGSVYNLFYNDTWQKPAMDTYWIHNGKAYADGIKQDLMECVKSAEAAFETWNSLPIVSRKKKLENLASILQCNGKFQLANTMLDWIKLSNIESQLLCQDGRLELIAFNMPKGIVPILYSDEVKAFCHLTLALIVGNCVIVICNKNSCTLPSYFNMFSTAEVPPGVVNLFLSKEFCQHFKECCYEPKDAHNYVNTICTSKNYIITPF